MPGASLAARSASLAGSECRLLPDFREGLMEGLRPADEATLQRLMRTAVTLPGGGGLAVLPSWPEALEVGGWVGG